MGLGPGQHRGRRRQHRPGPQGRVWTSRRWGRPPHGTPGPRCSWQVAAGETAGRQTKVRARPTWWAWTFPWQQGLRRRQNGLPRDGEGDKSHLHTWGHRQAGGRAGPAGAEASRGGAGRTKGHCARGGFLHGGQPQAAARAPHPGALAWTPFMGVTFPLGPFWGRGGPGAPGMGSPSARPAPGACPFLQVRAAVPPCSPGSSESPAGLTRQKAGAGVGRPPAHRAAVPGASTPRGWQTRPLALLGRPQVRVLAWVERASDPSPANCASGRPPSTF